MKRNWAGSAVRLRGVRGRNVLLTTGTTYLGIGLSLISTPMIARTLGVDGRGVLAASFGLLQLLSWMGFLSLPKILARNSRLDRTLPVRGLFWLLGLGLANAAASFLLATPLSNEDVRIATGIRCTSLVLLLGGVGMYGLEIALADGRLGLFNLGRLGAAAVPSALIIVAFLSQSLTLRLAFLAMFGGQLFATVVGLAIFLTTTKVRGSQQVGLVEPLRLWSASALDSVVGALGPILLGAVAVTAEVGVFAVAVTLASAAGALAEAVTAVSYSQFLSQAHGGRSSSARAVRLASMFGIISTAIVGSIVLLIVAVAGSTIFGPTFGGLTATTALMLVAKVMGEQWALRVAYDTARRDTSQLVWASLVGAALAVSGGFVLGMVGALTSITMAAVLCAAVTSRLAMRWFVSSPSE